MQRGNAMVTEGQGIRWEIENGKPSFSRRLDENDARHFTQETKTKEVTSLHCMFSDRNTDTHSKK